MQTVMAEDTKSRRASKQQAAKTSVASKADNPGKPAKRTGRPSSYTVEAGKLICELLASGKPLTPAMTKEHGLPDPTTIYRWTEDNEAFRLEYTRARQYQAHVYADQIIELADTAEDANLARIQVDTRKWYASKVLPKLYGDKQTIDVQVDMGKTAAAVLMDLSNRANVIEAQAIDVTPPLIGESKDSDNS